MSVPTSATNVMTTTTTTMTTIVPATMGDEKKEQAPPPPPDQPAAAEPGSGAPAAAVKTRPKKRRKPSPSKQPPKPLPPWKVLLHNDDHNDMLYVVLTILELTPLKEQEAVLRMKEAHKTGVALLLTTHKERAELYRDQFTSKGLTVTIEPAE